MKFKTICVALLCVALAELPFSREACAAMIPTGEVVNTLVAAENRSTVERYLARQDVQGQFARFGVNPVEASARVASLSDAEVSKIAGQIHNTPAGADVVVISLTSVLLVILILILLRKV